LVGVFLISSVKFPLSGTVQIVVVFVVVFELNFACMFCFGVISLSIPWLIMAFVILLVLVLGQP